MYAHRITGFMACTFSGLGWSWDVARTTGRRMTTCKTVESDRGTIAAEAWLRFDCHAIADFGEKSMKAMHLGQLAKRQCWSFVDLRIIGAKRPKRAIRRS